MLTYLWQNREKPPFLSRHWLKTWAKRLFLLPSLAGWSYRRTCLSARGSRIGQGSLIAPAQITGARWLTIGENSFVGRVQIQAQAPVQIGSRVSINDGVRILSASHDVRDPAWTQFAEPIRIGDYAWIATGATILPGVTIGTGAVIGACAVVAKDVPDFAVAIGNPAQVREYVRPRDLDYNPVRFLALFTAWLGTPGKKADQHPLTQTA